MVRTVRIARRFATSELESLGKVSAFGSAETRGDVAP